MNNKTKEYGVKLLLSVAAVVVIELISFPAIWTYILFCVSFYIIWTYKKQENNMPFPFLAIFFDNWIQIVIILMIAGCVYKTSDLSKRIGGVVLIILILLMDWFLKQKVRILPSRH